MLSGARVKRGGLPGTGEVNLGQAIFAGNNDWNNNDYDPRAYTEIRFRHGRNNTANFVFADGHAETLELKQNVNSNFKLGNLYVNPQ